MQRSLSHLSRGYGFAHGQSFGDEGSGTLELFAGDDGLTPALSTAGCGRGKTGSSALLDQVPLERSN